MLRLAILLLYRQVLHIEDKIYTETQLTLNAGFGGVGTMEAYTNANFEQVHKSLLSMLHKCEKTQQKLPLSSWQWSLMEKTIRGVKTALILVEKSPDKHNLTMTDFSEAHQVLSETLQRCLKAREKLQEGTSQWTLMKNRIHALEAALQLISKEMR